MLKFLIKYFIIDRTYFLFRVYIARKRNEWQFSKLSVFEHDSFKDHCVLTGFHNNGLMTHETDSTKSIAFHERE